MAEPERVRIRIRGTQKDAEGAVQHTETQAVARHHGEGGKHYLRYEDRTLLAGQAVPSLLKFSENGLTLVRHGAVEQRLEFVRGAERQGLTVSDLLERFRSGAGKALDNDRILLS